MHTHTHIHPYIHTSIHPYRHTYIHTRTYMHTYIHTHIIGIFCILKLFHPYNDPNWLFIIFQRGWNHQRAKRVVMSQHHVAWFFDLASRNWFGVSCITPILTLQLAWPCLAVFPAKSQRGLCKSLSQVTMREACFGCTVGQLIHSSSAFPKLCILFIFWINPGMIWVTWSHLTLT